MDEIIRHKFGPPDDTAMLPWYEGAYSHGFIALHPFFTVEGLDPACCEHGTLILTRSDIPCNFNVLAWSKQRLEDRRVGKQVSSVAVGDIVKRLGRNLSWDSICKGAGFSNHCELNRALLTHISALNPNYSDVTGAKRLVDYCTEEKIFLPTEGRFQPLMEHALVDLFERTGFDNVVAGDEFGEEERLVSLSTLKANATWSDNPILPSSASMRRLLAPDHSLFAWVHWDSFFTVIFMNDYLLEKEHCAAGLEGFWCSYETRVGWTFQPCISLAE